MGLDFGSFFTRQSPTIKKLDALLDESQLARFNLSYYGLSATNSPSGNAAALNKAFLAKEAAGGGILTAPPSVSFFQVAGLIDCGVAPFILRGGGPSATQFNKQDSGDLFSVVGAQNGGLFENFSVKYATGLTGRAIYVDNSESIVGRLLYFPDCPTAFYVDNGSIGCGLEICWMQNDNQNNAVQMVFFGSQCFVDRIVSRQPGIDNSNGPTGTIGLSLGSVSTFFASKVHLSHHETGMVIGHSAEQVFGEQIRIDARTNALLIQGNLIYTVRLRDLIAGRTQFSTITNSSGCIVDPQGGSIDDVEFEGSGFSDFGLYGYEFRGGTNLKLVGGASRGNGLAGVGVIGAGADVKAYGHDSLGADVGASAVQQYGFDVSNGRLWAIGCDLRGCTAAPTRVTSPGVLTNLNPVS